VIFFIHKINIIIVVTGIHYKVSCGRDTMQVDILKREEVSAIYLQHLKDFPGEQNT
jgi:hypothetical protein